ncbi:hypothetical protein LCGC14_1405400 [marine sediment metagenome]|uniref:Uncharacterized protein n=1 Tax=marine sediment metagenome TaxID=412755 RepID=A0A0F9MBA4_9ZZZZ
MADRTITPQRPGHAGATTTRTGSLLVPDTHIVRNDGATFLLFEKSAAVNCVVTVQTPATVGGLAVAERTFTITASGGDMVVGPFPPAIFNDAVGDLRFTLTDVDGLTVAAIH